MTGAMFQVPDTVGGALGTLLVFLVTLAAAIKACPVIWRGTKVLAAAIWQLVRVCGRTVRLAVKVPHMLADLVDDDRLARIEQTGLDAAHEARDAADAAREAVDVWKDAATGFGARLGEAERLLVDHGRRIRNLERDRPDPG